MLAVDPLAYLMLADSGPEAPSPPPPPPAQPRRGGRSRGAFRRARIPVVYERVVLPQERRGNALLWLVCIAVIVWLMNAWLASRVLRR